MLLAAGDNPKRLHSEAAWAQLCGVSPLQASSGKVTPYSLGRGGDPQANAALWPIVVVRIAHDHGHHRQLRTTREEGAHKTRVIRTLKRYAARGSIATYLAAKSLAWV
ncbi:MAG: transposase [Acidimicrobiales bacterium]